MMTLGHRNNLLMALGAIMAAPTLLEEKEENPISGDEKLPTDPISFGYEDFGEKFRKVELNIEKYDIPDLYSDPPNKKKKNGKDWRKTSPFKKRNKNE